MSAAAGVILIPQVNNAGIVSGFAPGAAGMAITYENARQIVETNYYGVKNVTEGLLPLLRPSSSAARIVNVTSRGALYDVRKCFLLLFSL